jgi:hypothetical protein
VCLPELYDGIQPSCLTSPKSVSRQSHARARDVGAGELPFREQPLSLPESGGATMC